jgi:hypothetical protein
MFVKCSKSSYNTRIKKNSITITMCLNEYNLPKCIVQKTPLKIVLSEDDLMRSKHVAQTPNVHIF